MVGHLSGYAYLVAAGAAGIGSGADLAVAYPRTPWSDTTFGLFWSLIVALDVGAGALAALIVSDTELETHASWLSGPLGWMVIGLAAALIVRANLLTISIGPTSVPLGFGLVYGTLRSLCERPLKGCLWDLNWGERDGRETWLLGRVDEKATTLSLERVERILLDYVNTVVPTSDAKSDAETGITAARGNNNPIDGIKQLVSLMNSRGYVKPLNRLLGRPSRAQVKQWRHGTDDGE
ncbi:MAG TPA: hypothetical protein VNC61_09165 [Acidimicrobiales bacterium]|nr:hypothetical protein [Acidimicrobiales bacterium]